MHPQTLNDIFYAIVERRQQRVMLAREHNRWVPISALECYRNVAGMARAMGHWGVAKGDRVAILSENRPEWAFTDFASLLLGAVVVPIYATLTAPQTSYILRDAGAKVAVVSSEEQLKKVLSIKEETALEKIVIMDPVEISDAVQMRPLMHKGPSGYDLELERCARTVVPEDLASIIYTSGTTGICKGVQLTHGNLTANVMNSLTGFEVRPEHVS
ncbi:MAG: AMP-binding protein, partial [Candidatus Sulfotelmatobacter sp.]